MLLALTLVSGLLVAPLTHRPAVAPGASLAHAARSAAPRLALDYKDPVVATEFEAVNAVPIEDVEEELGMSGIVVPPTMNEVEIRLMLVEMRLRKNGKMGEKKAAAPKKPVWHG